MPVIMSNLPLKPSMGKIRNLVGDNTLPFIPPSYGTKLSAGLDLVLQYDITLMPNCATVVDLGFQAAIPEGYCALICSRSGLGSKKGIYPRNLIGIIDADYRGNWSATLVEDMVEEIIDMVVSDKPATSNKRCYTDGLELSRGTAILQAVIVPFVHAEVTVLPEDHIWDVTERGEGGHGSTGYSRSVESSETDSLREHWGGISVTNFTVK